MTCTARFPNTIRCKSSPEFLVTGPNGDKSFLCHFHRDLTIERAERRKVHGSFVVRALEPREKQALLEAVE